MLLVGRASDVYLLGACVAGVLVVAAFTVARSTPPNWVLAAAAVAILIALVVVLRADRSSPEEAGAIPNDE